MQVFGEHRVNVHALFEQLRREGELTLVGAEAAISENKWKRYEQHAAMCSRGTASVPTTALQGFSVMRSCRMTYGNGLSSPTQSVKDIKPQAELHLQACSLQASISCVMAPLYFCKL